MGNHMAGDLIAKFAEIATAQRQPNETALELLDRAVAQAKAVNGFTPDAEFEAADPKNPTCCHQARLFGKREVSSGVDRMVIAYRYGGQLYMTHYDPRPVARQ